MKRLNELPDIASRQLGGINATPTLLCKIKLSASEAAEPRRRPAWQPVLAAGVALMFCIGAVGAALWGVQTDKPEAARITAESMIASHSAGDANEPAIATEAPRVAADVPKNSVSMRAGGTGGGGALFAKGDGSSFPLISVNGATYRMLVSPESVPSELLGNALGEVGEFNVEPALGTSDIVSNAVAVSETVYAISGMDGAMVAANVDGQTRVFQRVSYAGTAIIGSEGIGDTLCGEDDASALRWDGVGEISDADTVKALMSTLLNDSDYRGTGMSGGDSLQIELKNGLTLQLMIGDDAVSACGTWDCPDFIEAFHEAIGK